jgi:aminoglycoside phosphotransferase (APT) family kinase protein
LPGFATRDELLARYATASGLDVSGVSYYKAFGLWKLACILQGVYVRYAGGAAAGDRSGVDQFASHVGKLGERALLEVESL